MRIVCPACKTAYRIPPEKIPPRRVLARCNRCGQKIVIDPAGSSEIRSAGQVQKPAAKPEKKVAPIQHSGIWRRPLAFLIDAILIGGVVFPVGFWLRDQSPPAGVATVFLAALIYFGIFNSTIAKGQTIGKRLFKIKLQDSHGHHIPFYKSILRFCALCIPFLLIALVTIIAPMRPLMTSILYLIAIGTAGTIVYLYVFNRTTRQSLHDLALKTYVVKADRTGPVPVNPLWKGHTLAICSWLLVAAVMIHWAIPHFGPKFSVTDASYVHQKAPRSMNGPTASADRSKNQGHTRRNKPPEQPHAAPDPSLVALFKAVTFNNVQEVKDLLENGEVDVNVRGPGGQTALIRAVMQGGPEMVKCLLENGADVDARDQRGWTALAHANQINSESLARILIQEGADVNIANDEGNTPLLTAIQMSSWPLVDLLIEKGADVNVSNPVGVTPLMAAAQKGNREIVLRLINAGAAVDTATADGRTAMSFAIASQGIQIVKLLMDHGADLALTRHNSSGFLQHLCLNGEMELIKMLLDRGVDVNAPDRHGSTALISAVRNGDMRIVKYLLERGAEVNAVNGEGRTAFYYACGKCNNQNLLQLMIKHGAEIDKSDGSDLLRSAMFADCPANVKFLLAHGVDINARDRHGKTAIMWAAENDRSKIIELLLNGRADLSIRDYQGDTVLDLAKAAGVRKMLIAGGAPKSSYSADPKQFEMAHAMPYDKRLVDGLKKAIEQCTLFNLAKSRTPVQVTLSTRQLDTVRYKITYRVKAGKRRESYELVLSSRSKDVLKNIQSLEKTLKEYMSHRRTRRQGKPDRNQLLAANRRITEQIAHFDYMELFQVIESVDQTVSAGKFGTQLLYRAAEVYSWLAFFKNRNQNRDLSDLLAANAVSNYLTAGTDRRQSLETSYYKGLLLLALDYPEAAVKTLDKAKLDGQVLSAYIKIDFEQLKALRRNPLVNKRLAGYLLARAYQCSDQHNVANQHFVKLMSDYPDFLLAKEYVIKNGDVGTSRRLMQSYLVELIEKHLHLTKNFYQTKWLSDETKLIQKIREDVSPSNRLEKWLKIHAAFVAHSNQMKRPNTVFDSKFMNEFMRLDIWNALLINYHLEANRLARRAEAAAIAKLVDTTYPKSRLSLVIAVKQSQDRDETDEILSKISPETANRLLLQEMIRGKRWTRKKDLYVLKNYRLKENPDAYGSMLLHDHYRRFFYQPVARKYLQNALGANPYDTGGYKKILNYENCEGDIEKGKQFVGNQYGFLIALADWYAGKGDKKKAVQYYKLAIEVNPEQQTAYKNLGNLYAKEKKNAQAVDTWQSYFKYDNYSLSAVALKNAIGNLYLDTGAYEKAYAIFLESQKSYQAGALLGFARSSELTGKKLQAENVYRKAADRYPRSTCPANLGIFYLRQKNTEMSYKILSEYKRFNQFYYYYETLIDYFAEQGTPEKAIDVIRQIEGSASQDWWDCAYVLYQIYELKEYYKIAARLTADLNRKSRSSEIMTKHYELLLKAKLVNKDELVDKVFDRYKNQEENIYRIGLHLLETGYYGEAADIFAGLADTIEEASPQRPSFTLSDLLVLEAAAWRMGKGDQAYKRKIQKKIKGLRGDPWTTARVSFLLGETKDQSIRRHADSKEKIAEVLYYNGIINYIDGRHDEALLCMLMCLENMDNHVLNGYGHAHYLASKLAS